MTTQKALRKIMDCITENADKKIEDEMELLDLFSRYLYPITYKRNKQSAMNKTNQDIIVCVNRKYLDIDSNSTILSDFICLNENGAKRIEEKSDAVSNFIARALCALGGIVSTIVAGFLIEFIKSKI